MRPRSSLRRLRWFREPARWRDSPSHLARASRGAIRKSQSDPARRGTPRRSLTWGVNSTGGRRAIVRRSSGRVEGARARCEGEWRRRWAPPSPGSPDPAAAWGCKPPLDTHDRLRWGRRGRASPSAWIAPCNAAPSRGGWGRAPMGTNRWKSWRVHHQSERFQTMSSTHEPKRPPKSLRPDAGNSPGRGRRTKRTPNTRPPEPQLKETEIVVAEKKPWNRFRA